MKLSSQIGQMISILYATLTMKYKSRYPAIQYVLVNRSVLCNCGIEVEHHFLLKSLTAHKLKINYVLYSQYSLCQLFT